MKHFKKGLFTALGLWIGTAIFATVWTAIDEMSGTKDKEPEQKTKTFEDVLGESNKNE